MRPLFLTMLASFILVACDDHRGTPPPNVVVHLIDADSRADVTSARVLATPGDIEATTDLSGRATFTGLKPGAYRFAAMTPGLKLSGTSIGPDSDQTATSDEISVASGDANRELDLNIRRLDRNAINLTTLHDGRDQSFTVDNCQACHNDRKHEISTDPAIRPWHAMRIHSSTACTWCHRNVDLSNHSGGTIRKQVNVALCVGCHPRFPSFPSSL